MFKLSMVSNIKIYQIYLEVQQLSLSVAVTTEYKAYFSQNALHELE